MCFTLGFLEQLIVCLIVIGAVVACIKLLVPYIISEIGMPILGQVIMIVLWAVVAIMVVYLIFGLLGCAIGSGPPFHVRP